MGISKDVTITNDSNRLSKDQIDDMLKKAEQFKDDDEKQKKRVEARNNLEASAFRFKQSCEEEAVKSKLSEEDRKTVTEAAEDALRWLDSNQSAEVEEYEAKNKELEGKCMGIMAKVYQPAGGEATQPTSSQSNAGPTIEEVD